MYIISYQLHEKSIPLRKPLYVRGELQQQRDVLELELNDNQGNTYWGEAAPLPGLNLESLQQAKEQLTDFLNKYLPCNSRDLDTTALFTSAQCAIAGALINKDQLAPVKINSLVLPAELSNINNQTGTYKLKIQAQSFPEDLLKLTDFRQQNPEATLRLDANGTLCWQQFTTLVEQQESLQIEYIEEPFANLGDWKKIKSYKCSLKLALDENLMQLKHNQYASHWILKPQTLGYQQTSKLAQEALDRNIIPIISSNYEGPVGMSKLIVLVNELGLTNVVHGLGTLEYFDLPSNGGIFLQNNSIILR